MILMRCFLVCLLLLLSGCASSAFFEKLPDSHLLTTLDDSQLFAVSPDGESIAYVDKGLNFLRLADNYQQKLTYDSPEALIWSPDGRSLVAAFREPEKTRLVRLTTTSDDRPQIFVDEQLTDFAWLTDGRLLAMAQTTEAEEGLLQVQASLVIWDGEWDVERIPLYKKRFYRRKTDIETGVKMWHQFDLSPLKDELIFCRYLDLPILDGRVELVLYNLLTKRELVLTETDNRQTEAFLAGDAESVLLPSRTGQVKFVNPWKNEVKYNWKTPGEALQLASQGELFFIDGKLFSADRLQLTLPVGSKAVFSEDGSRLFVAWKRKLYLYSDYHVPAGVQFTGVEKVKLQRIRQQRSRGEISIRDYYQARNNILNP